MEQKRLLIVSLEFPYPLNSGGTRDIYSRVQAMHEAGYTIDLIATVREQPAAEDIQALRPLVESIRLVHRSRGLGDLIRMEPFLARSRRGLKNIRLEHKYLAVILETEHVGGILENPTLCAGHRIIRIHNRESHLYRCLSRCASTIREKGLLAIESVKLRLYSPKVMRQCDIRWYISSTEMNHLEGSQPEGSAPRKSYLVRSVVESSSFHKRSLTGSSVLYVGALSVHINYHGIIWYLKNVHPHLLEIPDYHFVLAGRKGSANLSTLMEVINASERVFFQPDIENLGAYFATAAAFINPVQSGAGVKIKIYDATAEGMPVVTTPAGAEGTDFINGIHVVVADSPDSFVAGLKRVLVDKTFAQQLVENAQNQLKRDNLPDNMLSCLSSLA